MTDIEDEREFDIRVQIPLPKIGRGILLIIG